MKPAKLENFSYFLITPRKFLSIYLFKSGPKNTYQSPLVYFLVILPLKPVQCSSITLHHLIIPKRKKLKEEDLASEGVNSHDHMRSTTGYSLNLVYIKNCFLIKYVTDNTPDQTTPYIIVVF